MTRQIHSNILSAFATAGTVWEVISIMSQSFFENEILLKVTDCSQSPCYPEDKSVVLHLRRLPLSEALRYNYG